MAACTIAGLMFSKDRAMQLDAALRSFLHHCKDCELIDMKVLYTTSDVYHRAQYNKLKQEYGLVEFIEECDFKQQVLSSIVSYKYVLFLVDDNIFVRAFSAEKIVNSLDHHYDAIGFSLRLGTNTIYCYTLSHAQNLPDFQVLEDGFLKFDWTKAGHDFNYPLEVSSSLYRVKDLYPMLEMLEFTGPNALECEIHFRGNQLKGEKRHLLCNKVSFTFCNPVNVVQDFHGNLHGTVIRYTSKELRDLFENGYRIDVEKYSGFIPNACHQEVELIF